VQGPDLRVGPHAAMSIALALHELATNAVKYGALSSPQGAVDVRWQLPGEAFEFTWAESGGPTVVPAERRGFGSRLLLQVLPRELEGATDIDYRSEGVTFKLATSLEAVNDRPASEGV